MITQERSLAIIGGGAAGVAAFIAAVQYRAAEIIYIIDPKIIGPGIAFSASDDDILCNTSVNSMSILADNPTDFLEYLINKGHAAEPSSFAPRRWVGEYLTDRFNQYCDIAHQYKINVIHTPFLFRSLKIEANHRYQLFYGNTQPYDVLSVTDVIFCTGFGSLRLPNKLKPYQDHPALIKCPYPEREMLDKIEPNSNVLIIGSKLSAIDAALLLCREGHKVTMISPSGELPAVRTQFIRKIEGVIDPDDLSVVIKLWNQLPSKIYDSKIKYKYLKYFAHLLKINTNIAWRKQFSYANNCYDRLYEEINLAESGSTQWQDFIISFVVNLNEKYLEKENITNDYFHPDFNTLLERYITAIALPNAQKIYRYIDEGLLSIQQGEIEYITAAEENNLGSWLIDWGKGKQHFNKIISAIGYNAPYFIIGKHGEIEINTEGGGNKDSIEILPSMAAKIEKQENIWFFGMPIHTRIWIPNSISFMIPLINRIMNSMKQNKL